MTECELDRHQCADRGDRPAAGAGAAGPPGRSRTDVAPSLWRWRRLLRKVSAARGAGRRCGSRQWSIPGGEMLAPNPDVANGSSSPGDGATAGRGRYPWIWSPPSCGASPDLRGLRTGGAADPDVLPALDLHPAHGRGPADTPPPDLVEGARPDSPLRGAALHEPRLLCLRFQLTTIADASVIGRSSPRWSWWLRVLFHEQVGTREVLLTLIAIVGVAGVVVGTRVSIGADAGVTCSR